MAEMSTPGRYRQKPVVVEALLYAGPEDKHAVRAFVTDPIDEREPLRIWNSTEACWIPVRDGHWIIKGIAGEFYPCAPDVFDATYELIIQGLVLRRDRLGSLTRKALLAYAALDGTQAGQRS